MLLTVINSIQRCNLSRLTPESHPVDVIYTSHCTNLPREVHETDVPFCGGVQLPHLDAAKSIQKLLPNICSYPVANGKPHSVVPVVSFLRVKKVGFKKSFLQ